METKQAYNEVSSMPSCIGKTVYSHTEQSCHSHGQNGYRHPKGHVSLNTDSFDGGHGSSLRSIESGDGVSDGHGRFLNSFSGVPDGHGRFSNSFNGVSDGHGGSSGGGHDSFLNTHCFGGISDGHGKSSNTDSFAGVSDGRGRSSNTDSFDGVSDGHGRSCNADSVDGVSDGHGRSINTDGFDSISGGHTNTNSVDGVSKCYGRSSSFDGVGEDKKGYHVDHQNGHVVTEAATSKPAKRRPFCNRCRKVQKLCICKRFKGVVQNKIKITILQNPEEKHHAVGSARVALLGLQNIALVNVPEVHSKESFRIRPKIPGSKRSLAGRGGKKLLLKGGNPGTESHSTALSEAAVLQLYDRLAEIFKDYPNHMFPLEMLHSFMHPSDGNGMADGVLPLEKPHSYNNGKMNGTMHSFNAMHFEEESRIVHELETLIPPRVALLYPSEKAIELSEPFFSTARHDEQEVHSEGHPHHLIVLDGTWSKARRIYFENPWLQSIPHYKLSLSSPSLYEGVRKQPKPGCLSTLESIVYALKVLEPEAKELDELLEVFDSMVEDQRRCKQMKSFVLESSME